MQAGEATFPLVEGRIYRIGSGEENELRLEHGSVAPRHAWISLKRGIVQIENLDPAHPTFVNGRAVDSLVLERHDRIRVGAIELRLVPYRGGAPEKRKAAEVWRAGDATFHEYLAAEMRRAPWFALSLAIHLAIVLLLWILLPTPRIEPAASVAELHAVRGLQERFDLPRPDVPIDSPAEPLEQLPVVEEPSDRDDVAAGAGDSDPGERAPKDRIGLGIDRSSMFTKIATGDRGDGDGVGRGGDRLGLGGGAFRQRVRELRASGLDVVFVFDSTSSMQSVIEDAKSRIERMVQVLGVLVPEARIGIVTYRDHGRGEEYVVRTLPLGSDIYRAVNFVHTVRAGGGGDTEEAVLEALQAAFALEYRQKVQRIVVLVGDAPPHEHSLQKLRDVVRRFANDGRSVLHTILTPAGGREQARATARAFSMLSAEGRGISQSFDDAGAVLLQVLDLAFGGSYRKDLDEVYEFVDRRRSTVTTFSRDLVRRLDVAGIQEGLERVPSDDDLVRALALTRDRRVAEFLAEYLARTGRPAHARHAAAYALQRILTLELPPYDPTRDRPLEAREVSTLKRLATERL